MPDKDKLFLLIENIVSTNEPKSETQMQELIAFLMVLVGSIANQYTEEDNFAAEAEIWIALYLHILYFQTTYGCAIKSIEVVRAVIFEMIDSSLQKFVAEISMRKKYSEIALGSLSLLTLLPLEDLFQLSEWLLGIHSFSSFHQAVDCWNLI